MPVESSVRASQEKKCNTNVARSIRRRCRAVPYLLRLAVLCSLLLCSGSLYAYAQFRSARGEGFLQAINQSPMILGTRLESTWGAEAYADLLVDHTEYMNPYLVSAHYVFWWGAGPHRAMAQYEQNISGNELLSVATNRSAAAVYVDTFFAPPDGEWKARTAKILQDVKERFAHMQQVTWFQGVVSQTRWGLPSVVGLWISRFVTTDSDVLLMLLQALPGILLSWAGILPLAVLILAPSGLAITAFWLWIGWAGLYIVVPANVWRWLATTIHLPLR